MPVVLELRMVRRFEARWYHDPRPVGAVKARPLLTQNRQCSVTHRRCVVVIANLVLTHPAYGSYVDIS